MAVYLLGDISKESEAAAARDGCGERAQHFGREILAFIDDYVAVTAAQAVGLKLIEYAAGKVGPVVLLASLLALNQVALVDAEQ